MKTLNAAPKPDFDSYIGRESTAYALREGESLEELYERGFLPYSSSRGLHGVFYSARSARVILPRFEMSSENRRIAKKFDGQFSKRRVPISELAADEDFYAFVTGYFAKRHGPNAMPRERLELIVTSGLVSECLIYQAQGRTVGYVLEVQAGSARHYWYSAYDLELARQSLGLWLMLDTIRDAKEAGTTHYYLGTVYGQKALYKTNFGPLEWHDGSAWSADIARLKELSRGE